MASRKSTPGKGVTKLDRQSKRFPVIGRYFDGVRGILGLGDRNKVSIRYWNDPEKLILF